MWQKIQTSGLSSTGADSPSQFTHANMVSQIAKATGKLGLKMIYGRLDLSVLTKALTEYVPVGPNLQNLPPPRVNARPLHRKVEIKYENINFNYVINPDSQGVVENGHIVYGVVDKSGSIATGRFEFIPDLERVELVEGTVVTESKYRRIDGDLVLDQGSTTSGRWVYIPERRCMRLVQETIEGADTASQTAEVPPLENRHNTGGTV